MRYRVYVAGPITIGDQIVNVRRGIDTAIQLLKLGYIPFCPHLSFAWHLIQPMTHQQWLDYDLAWLAQCHCMLRLPGESAGAAQEELFAHEMGIPVFHTLTELEAGIAEMEEGKDWADDLGTC